MFIVAINRYCVNQGCIYMYFISIYLANMSLSECNLFYVPARLPFIYRYIVSCF